MTDEPHGERRKDNLALHALMERLSEQSGDLEGIANAYGQFVASQDERYERFTRRVLRGLAILAVFTFAALAAGGYNARQANVLANQQKDGRRFAINTLCGAISGVADAGQSVIKLGARTPAQRAQAQLVAASYARQIGESVARTTTPGAKASDIRGLVRLDGTLDCAKLRDSSAAR